MSSPLPDISHRSRPSLSPIAFSASSSPVGPLSAGAHSRSHSAMSSLGRRAASAAAEIGKYTESEVEDYDDVFLAKANGSSEFTRAFMLVLTFDVF
jgi:hypothetical protein